MSVGMTLHEYQRQAVAFALQSLQLHGGVGLFLEPGLGKTLCTIALMDIIHAADPEAKFLIIAPKLVAQESWPDEMEKWSHLHTLSYAVALGTKKQRTAAVAAGADVTIINQENVRWLDETYRTWPYTYLIIDELSGYKSSKSQRFRILSRRRKKVHGVIGLTGTPATKNMMDLWAQMRIIDGGDALFDTVTKFRETYFMPSRWMGHQIIEYQPLPGAPEEILERIADRTIAMRAQDKLPGLPDQIEQDVWLAMPEGTREVYRDMQRELVANVGNSTITAVNAGVLTAKLAQLTCGCLYPNVDDEGGLVQHCDDTKLEALAEIVDRADGPVLVFYQFTDELERMRKRFPKLREIHEEGVLDEWRSGQVPLLAAHPAAAKYGLNIQKGGHTIVWTSLPWSFDDYRQACDRLHRQGQTRPVVVYRLLESGTVDRRKVDVLSGRVQLHEAVMGALQA